MPKFKAVADDKFLRTQMLGFISERFKKTLPSIGENVERNCSIFVWGFIPYQ